MLKHWKRRNFDTDINVYVAQSEPVGRLIGALDNMCLGRRVNL